MRRDKNNLKHFVGQRLRDLREDRELTQAELAEAVFMATESYGRLERGLSFPSVPTLIELHRVLGTSVDNILGIDDNNGKSTKRPEVERVAQRMDNLNRSSLRVVINAVDMLVDGASEI